MQDVNNDMDDLFRKAAEQYPLKTEGADWQKVFTGLQGASVPAAEEKEKRKRRALWLFLLLPLALVWAVYYKDNHQPVQQKLAVNEVAENGKADSDSPKPDSEPGKKTSLQKTQHEKSSALSLSSTELTNSSKSYTADKSKILPGGNREKDSHKGSILNSPSNPPAIIKQKNEAMVYGKSSLSYNTNQAGTNYNNDLVHSNQPNYGSDQANDDGSQPGDKKNNFSAQQPTTTSDRIDKKDMRFDNDEVPGKTEPGKADSLVVADTAGANKDNVTNNAGSKKMVKINPRIQTGFYAGLLASFDLSTIKLQRINKTGYGYELLLGYRFSKRLSVESGMNWTDKKYYSIGKYFHKGETGISPDSKIIYTNGSCAMFEIPAVVKYDFALQKKSNWFATAGLSSYIMKDETYNYYAIHSGNYYYAERKYKNSGSNLFSVASLSLGYQLQLNKHLSLRAEPYIKMPLSGIGIAKMPITSTGITAGFTRSF